MHLEHEQRRVQTGQKFMGMFWNFESNTKLSRSTAYPEKGPPMGGKKIDLRVDSCCRNLCNENQAASEGKEREAERCRERETERESNTSETKKKGGGSDNREA